MKSAAVKKDDLQIVDENRCPFCGGTYLINKGIGFAIGDMMVKWQYRCGNNACRQLFYIKVDLSRY